MTEEQDEVRLVCSRIEDVYDHEIEGECYRCGHTVGIAKAGVSFIEDNPNDDIEIWCGECYLEYAHKDPGLVSAAPGALDEVERILGPEAREWAEQELRKMNARWQ